MLETIAEDFEAGKEVSKEAGKDSRLDQVIEDDEVRARLGLPRS
ncbi:hypothetical protein ML401_38825 [Bradyrhizobium sp. 62B]|nr:hypothetical protein ML401_38825 [Bradyrhizobium sp. 62B]